MFTALLGWSLAIASALTILPTPIKLIRKNSSSGVSSLTSIVAIVAMLSWSFYTLNLKDYPALASSLGPLLCWSATLYLLAFKYQQKNAKIYLLATTPLLIIIGLLPTKLQGSLAVIGSLLWALPQLKKAFTSSSLKGISVLSYLFVALENLAWVGYALLTKHYAYAFAPLLQGPVALLIALKANLDKSRSPAK